MSPRLRGSSLLLYLIFFIAALLGSHAARAAPDDALARAKQHFDNGVHLYDQKPPDYEAALAEFRAAEKERPSPGIKKNIALCLKALHRYGEAIDELNAMLAAGDAVKPETRETGKKILAEIQALIATLKIKVVLHRSADQTGNDVPHVDVALDGQSVPSEKLAGSVRTGPGDHVIVAHATGYGDATKKVSVVAGDKDVLVQLDLVPVAAGAGLGSLHVHSNVPQAQISIDNVALANGTWEGGVPAGHHHVEVASQGLPTWSRDVDVANGQRVDLEATLGDDNAPPPPPPYESGSKPPEKEQPRPWYLMGGIGGYTATYTMAGSPTRTPGGGPLGDTFDTERGFNGLLLNARGGRDFGKFFSAEVFLEVGGAKPASWKNGPSSVDATITYGAIGPEFRVHSPGKVVRVILGTGFGLEGVGVTVNNPPGSSQTKKGGGVEGLWLLEGGAQFRLGPRMFIETDLFFEVSGDGSIKDNTSSARYFEDSPLTRGGLRAFLGLTL